MFFRIFVILFFSSRAVAHEWYPIFCCNKQDCDKAQQVSIYPDGTLELTVKQQTAKVTNDTQIFESKDQNVHGCIREKKLICIFLPISH